MIGRNVVGRLRVGYVPEHFSTPLFMAQIHGYYKDAGVDVEFVSCKEGSGQMSRLLKEDALDVAVGLTEAFVGGIMQGISHYKLVGQYVASPLCWAISVGRDRTDLQSMDDLKGTTVGISRVGSGSYVMPFVIAKQKGWPAFAHQITGDFKNLRDGVNHTGSVKPIDYFLWEHFTSKRYYDSGEIKRIGEIYTPWPSWVVVGRDAFLKQDQGPETVSKFLTSVNKGIEHFNRHHDEAVEYIAANLDYSKEDATSWLDTVKFVDDTLAIDEDAVVTNTLDILKATEMYDPAKAEGQTYVFKL